MTTCLNCGVQAPDGISHCPACGTPARPPVADDVQTNKGMAVLAYILFFVPLITGAHKNSPYVRYHTNQGTVLFLTAVGWGILYAILTAVITAMLFNPATWTYSGLGLTGVITMILGLLWLIPAALCVLGIVHAATGKTKPLPVIGRFNIVK